MSFSLILIFCLIAYILLRVGLSLYISKNPVKYDSCPDYINAVSFYLASLIGGGALSILFADVFSLGVFFVWALGGWAVLVLEQKGLPLKKALPYQLLIVLLSILFMGYFPSTLNLLALGSILLTTLLGVFLWRVFVFFDRFPITSFLVTLTWIISLLSIGFFQNFPGALMLQVAFLTVITIISMQVNLKNKSPFLGRISASLIGFLWLGVWCYFLAKGSIIQTVSMFGYYVFESIILLIAFFKKKPLETFLFHLIQEPKFIKKSVSVVFYHLLILSFCGVMTMQMELNYATSLILFVTVIVLVDLYIRLGAFEKPIPTWKELFSDTKKSILSMADQFKQKSQKKEKISSRKESSHKKTKKKVVRKK